MEALVNLPSWPCQSPRSLIDISWEEQCPLSIEFSLQVLTLFKKLELGDVTREMSSSEVGNYFSRFVLIGHRRWVITFQD